MKLKKLALLLVILFAFPIFISSGQALPDIVLSVKPVTDKIPYNGVAKFELEITNNQDIKDIVFIPTPRSQWGLTLSSNYVTVGAKDSATLIVVAAPPKYIQEGKYSLYFEARSQNNLSVTDYKYLHVYITESGPVQPKAPLVVYENATEELQYTQSFLTELFAITIYNTGDTEITRELVREFTTFDSFFVVSNPQVSQVVSTETGKEFHWVYSLKPGEYITIYYSVSYLPLLIAGILFIAAIITLGYYYYSHLDLRKQILVSRKIVDGGKSIKIKLHLRNKSYKAQSNVTLRDYVPVPMKLVKDFGTLEPTAIKKSKSSIVLIWKFKELAPREERIVSYHMKSSMEVLGKIRLPAATLVQKLKNKTFRTKSQILQIK